MNDKDMEYILKTEEFRSILKASENLGITTSALSKAVQRVEEQYGVRLFQRIGKTFYPTYAGQRYVDWANRINEAQMLMDRDMQSLTGKETERINIGTTEIYDEIIINDVLPVFRDKYPSTEINIYKRTKSSLLRDLSCGKIDFIVTIFDTIPINCYSRIIKKEGLCLMIEKNNMSILKETKHREGRNYPWIDFKEILEEDFVILPAGRRLRKLLDGLFDMYNKKPNISVEVTNVYDMLQLISLDIGIGINYPSLVTKKLRDKIVSIEFGRQPIVATHAIIWNPNCRMNSQLNLFIELCSEVLNKTLNK